MSNGDVSISEIEPMVKQLQRLQLQAAQQYQPVEDALLRTGSRDVQQIEHMLEGLLDFCSHAPVLEMYPALVPPLLGHRPGRHGRLCQGLSRALGQRRRRGGCVIAGLKPYAEYSDSGLPWLGQVPAHWRTVRNGSLFGQRSQTGFAELPILEVSLKTGVQVRAFGSAKRKQVMSDLAKYKRAVKGDLAYNTMRMWQGALGVCPVDGLVSPAYVVARPYAGVEPQYFAALFRTGDYMAEIDAASRGIVKDRNRLYWDQFKQMQSPCPPPDEQAAIRAVFGLGE